MIIKAKKLILEINKNAHEVNSVYNASMFGNAMITPKIDEEYWICRVRVSRKQTIICFPKFRTYGIGFQTEKKDWNTNLPYTIEAEKIYNHIKINKGNCFLSKKTCIEAIKMLQEFIRNMKKDKKHD